jgi:hypothetical protein
VQESLDKILSIALAMFNSGGSFSSSSTGQAREDALFHRIEWPLFIAGVESKDIIHQDWIRQNMGVRNTKVAGAGFARTKLDRFESRSGIYETRFLWRYTAPTLSSCP